MRNQPGMFRLLERLTALILLLVVASLVWILIAAENPEWSEGSAGEVQVIVIVVLVSAALVMVSIVALIHTRRDPTA